MYEPIKVSKVDSLMSERCTKPKCGGELLKLIKNPTELGPLQNYLCRTCKSNLQLYAFEEKARLEELAKLEKARIPRELSSRTEVESK